MPPQGGGLVSRGGRRPLAVLPCAAVATVAAVAATAAVAAVAAAAALPRQLLLQLCDFGLLLRQLLLQL